MGKFGGPNLPGCAFLVRKGHRSSEGSFRELSGLHGRALAMRYNILRSYSDDLITIKGLFNRMTENHIFVIQKSIIIVHLILYYSIISFCTDGKQILLQ